MDDTYRYLAEVLAAWRSPALGKPQILYFPVRHQSPACAAVLRRWIAANQPVSVLIEGPGSFTELIPHLVNDDCVCPVAIYTYFVDKQKRLESGDVSARFAAYYPVCDYSPELVALRDGHTLGARLRFIDLEFAEMTLIRQPGIQHRADLLSDDPHLAHSRYVRELARRFGCRDFNELWDHAFETAFDLPEDEFAERLLTYCALARRDYSQDTLERDATLAREQCMAAAVRDEIDKNRAENRDGPILVVTGGFHTVVLPGLVDKAERPKSPKFVDSEVNSYLIRYSFDQLDALSGYTSGMPSPAFYDRLWHAEPTALGRQSVVADWLVDIARMTRTHSSAPAVSTADAVAAMEATQRIAELRGHPWPQREDVLDAMRSSFVKGEMDVEGRLLMSAVFREMAGVRIGRTPGGAAVPPIVDDFRREASRLRLPVESVERREMALELYRKPAHRQVSRFFHRLDLLGAPFAVFQSGPDFVNGVGLDRMQEVWRVCWSPATESSLIDAATRGPTVEEAALHVLVERIGHLEKEGKGRSASTAVDFLVRACRLGLHARVDFLLTLIDTHIAEDASFASIVAALSQLDQLRQACEPLEAKDLVEVPRLAALAYRRACKMLDDLCGGPDESIAENLKSLRILRDVVVSNAITNDADNLLDAELFHSGLERLVAYPFEKSQPALAGAAAGILYSEGRMSEDTLVRLVGGYLGGSGAARKTAGILRGLLATAREIAWQVASLIRAIDEQFAVWDRDDFLNALPELRLAFTDLTPREILQVADAVADLHGKPIGPIITTDLEESEVALGLRISQAVRGLLVRDGLIEDLS